MARYASKTKVPVDKTRAEIERTLERYGASQFTFGRDDEVGKAVIQFKAHDRYVRYVLSFSKKPPTPKAGYTSADYARWEAECRQKWVRSAAHHQGETGGG